MSIVDSVTSIGSKITSEPLFEEFYIVIVHLISGLIFSVSILFLILNPTQMDVNNALKFLMEKQIRTSIYILFLVLLYTMGILSTTIFDCIVYFVSVIINFFSKKTNKLDKIKDFLMIPGILTTKSKRLYEGYKETVVKKLAKYFDLENCSSEDLVRLSQIFCSQQKMSKIHKDAHTFIIGKSLFIFTLFLSIRFLINGYFFLFLIFFLVSFYILVILEEKTISVRIRALDNAIVRLANKK